MKEKVLSLAKGNFIYEPPELLIDPDKLVFCVASGEKTTEAFLLKNRRGTKLKGFGSVDEPFLQFLLFLRRGRVLYRLWNYRRDIWQFP